MKGALLPFYLRNASTNVERIDSRNIRVTGRAQVQVDWLSFKFPGVVLVSELFGPFTDTFEVVGN